MDPTYVFDSGWSWKNYFEIKGNDLYLKEGYRFDYEGYGLGHNNTLSTWNWGWSNTSLSARFTPSDGSAVIDQALSISITDVDEAITVAPETVYKNIFGATIGTINFNQNDFSRVIVSPHTFFEQSEEFEQTFKVGNVISAT